MTIDEFIKKVFARPLPQSEMARVRTLAKELAESTGVSSAESALGYYMAVTQLLNNRFGITPE